MKIPTSCICSAICRSPAGAIKGWPWRCRSRCWEAVMICSARLAKCSNAQDLGDGFSNFFWGLELMLKYGNNGCCDIS